MRWILLYITVYPQHNRRNGQITNNVRPLTPNVAIRACTAGRQNPDPLQAEGRITPRTLSDRIHDLAEQFLIGYVLAGTGIPGALHNFIPINPQLE